MICKCRFKVISGQISQVVTPWKHKLWFVKLAEAVYDICHMLVKAGMEIEGHRNAIYSRAM